MKTTQLFRLISIINSLFIIPACSAQNPSQSLIEDIFEDLSVNNSVDNAVNEPNWENELEELSVRLHEPVDLNRATRQQLEQFPFLSDIQIEHLLAYIYVHGQMKTLYELQLIEDMDRQTIQYLLPFVCIKAINNESSFRWKTMLKDAGRYGKNEVLTRLDIPFYKRKGYEHTYLGPSVYNSVKYAFRYRDQLYAGFVAEKDAGEPFFALHNRQGYDYYSFYLLLKDCGRLKTLAVGNYRLSFGQGLVISTDYLLGKTVYASSFNTRSGGIRKHSSTDETNYFRGAAATLSITKQWSISGFYSHRSLDGVLTEKSYVSVRHMQDAQGNNSGYLFLCSSGARLTDFKEEFWSNFFFSACVMLLCASVLTSFLMRKLTDPLQKITDAAQRFGGGDFSVRVEGVEGEGEVVDLARTFNQMAENIQSNDNSRGQFMGNIAHELRTPMTTIKGFVDGILDGTIPPDMQNHYLQLVSEETGRLARLIQNMLDLSKLESGEYQVNARMFNIWETLTGVALSAEQRINDGMIDLEGLTMDEKVLVYADPDLIHQVAYNILDNAIKFTPAGGTIKFHVEKLGPEVEISIWNSGQGISPEALPYVFQRFYKEDRSRGLHARGAGLGLNICKVLVNLSGGQIRVESQQGEWCQFVFTLPATPPNPSGMKRLPDESGQPVPVEDPASMKPVN